MVEDFIQPSMKNYYKVSKEDAPHYPARFLNKLHSHLNYAHKHEAVRGKKMIVSDTLGYRIKHLYSILTKENASSQKLLNN